MTEIINTKEWKRFLNEVKPERKKPVQRESELQKSCVRWFRYTYPQYKDLLFSIPNEGKRTPMNGARMKAMGRVAGVPDLFLAIARHGFHGFFIEMKADKNTITPAQFEMISALQDQKYRVIVMYSLATFQSELTAYLVVRKPFPL